MKMSAKPSLSSFSTHGTKQKNNILGTCSISLEKWKKALENFEKARQITIKTVGEDASFVEVIDENIGETLYQMGKFEEARKHMNMNLDRAKMSN